ncbi:chemotaxis protein CheB [Actinoplanes sp. N902-109]|uniref:chemotaxis protein CheB n=1 Tax=Actinoplanes sp. (strain N902-109) TaxID=649831 RepID=UPI0018DCD13E|nr:chemotaxis protein CheB [Actinoplanes sp. N902-109]
MADILTGTPRWPFPVVALAFSAGGLDALVRILAALPVPFPGAVVVLRHHAPQSPDVLAPLLTAGTGMPVGAARDGEKLRAGRGYVAPAGFHTLITPAGQFALLVSGERPPYRPSADLLLTSLALSAGRRAVAVVLSGYGSDGAVGASAVHRFGGVVIASNRDTSSVYAMPAATIARDHTTDHVLAVEDIAAALARVTAATAESGGEAVQGLVHQEGRPDEGLEHADHAGPEAVGRPDVVHESPDQPESVDGVAAVAHRRDRASFPVVHDPSPRLETP